jgi:hypothetical protein
MEARLCFVGHVLMENRSGLLVDSELTRASGHAACPGLQADYHLQDGAWPQPQVRLTAELGVSELKHRCRDGYHPVLLRVTGEFSMGSAQSASCAA